MTKTDPDWISATEFDGFPPLRAPDTHKGTYGHLAVVAGSMGFHGAGVLVVHAAQRAQPGLVTLLTEQRVYLPIAAQLQSAMVGVCSGDIHQFDNASAIVIGPGLAAPDIADSIKTVFRRLWRDATVPMVVDAGALEWLVPHTFEKNAIRVLTPHPGEAAKILKQSIAQVQAAREQSLREISRRHGNCWVVLKGHQTLVGRAEGAVLLNPTGNPHLAQGGSGDALAGFMAGLLAQRALQADPGRTIRYAVWQHGAAADKLQSVRKNWVVEDLVNELGNAR